MSRPKKGPGRTRLVPADHQSFLLRVPPELLRSLRTLTGMRKTRSVNLLIWQALCEWSQSQVEHSTLKRMGLTFPLPPKEYLGAPFEGGE